jgi:PAS domain S-box-containing protein
MALLGVLMRAEPIASRFSLKVRHDRDYYRIFEGAHVALWDEDFSALVARLEELRKSGVSDLHAYFEERPQEVAEAVKLVRVRDVNTYAMELFEARHKKELLGALGAIFLPETEQVFLAEMIALWEGQTRFESEAPMRTLGGRRLDVLLTISWEGDRSERALVSILDISKQKASERRLETLNELARTISSDLELERIVQLVTDSATKLSGAQFGAFFYNIADESGERLTLYTLAGAPREAFERFGVPRNTAVFEPTFRGTAIVRSDDIRLDPRYGRNSPHQGMPEGHLPVVSYLAVPVTSRSGEVHGGLFFGHERPGIFTQEAEDIVVGIAAHAAIAIDNASLLRTAQIELARRKQAELNSRRFAQIVQSSQDAIVGKNLEGTITSWNPGAESLFGYTPDEIVGKPITTLFPSELEAEEADIIDKIRRGQRIEHYETVRRRKDGTLIDISLTISPVMDSDGTVIGASKIARDITERKRAEATLARRMEEQAALYSLTDRLYHGTTLLDAHEAALDAIIAALKCHRASILLFDKQKVMRFVAWRGLSESYRRAVDGHSPWTAETTDAKPLYISDVGKAELEPWLRSVVEAEGIGALAFIPLFGNGMVIGKFMAYYNGPHEFTVEDDSLAVTIARQLGLSVQRIHSEEARRRAESELHANEERERSRAAELEAIMEAVPAAIWISRDADCRAIRGNRASHGLLRLPPDANLSQSAPPAERPNNFDVRANGRVLSPDELPVQRAARGEEIRGFEEEVRFADGESRFLIGNATPLQESDGTPRGAVAAFVDITDRRRAEDSLRESEQRLQMALEAGGMGAWEWNVASGQVIWSPGLEAIHGLEAGTFGGTLEDFKRDIHPDDVDAVLAEIRDATDQHRPYHVSYRIVLADSSVRWLEAFGRCVEDSGGILKKLTGVCMDVTKRKEAEAQREILVAELSHRVKNALAIVLAIARQTFLKQRDIEQAYRSFDARVRALAQAHSRLAEAHWSGVSLEVILADELAPYRQEDGANVRIGGPPITLSPKSALSLSMAFHELATNAAKYGALSAKDGFLDVNWETLYDSLHIKWSERGGPMVMAPATTGFGRILLEKVLANDLKGDIELDYHHEGVRCSFKFPLAIAQALQPGTGH